MTQVQDAQLSRQIVVPGRGGRHRAEISTRPSRDVPVGDLAMGGHAAFALGPPSRQADAA